MAQTAVEVDSHSSVLQEALDRLATFGVDSFRRRPSSHTLSNVLDKSIKVTMLFLLLLKCVFYRLGKVYELAFSTRVLPEGGLFFGDKSLISRCHLSLLLTMRSRVLSKQLSKLKGLLLVFVLESFYILGQG